MKKLLLSLLLILAPVAAFAVIQGLTPYFNATATNTVTVAYAKPCTLGGYHIDNTTGNTGPVWIQLFDASSTSGITLGTTTPTFSFSVPTNGVLDGPMNGGIAFQNGIVYAITTTVTGSTAPANANPTTLLINQ